MTKRRAHLMGLSFFCCSLAACGGGSPAAPDAQGGAGTTGGGGSAAGAGGQAAGADGGDDATDDADAGADANDDGAGDGATDAVDAAPEVEPVVIQNGTKLLVSGTAELVGSGPDSCTNQTPAPGDRWCAFTKPGVRLGLHELWVVNVTRAATALPVKCDGTDANCLRITTNLFPDVTTGFAIHGFDGDTLIYYAELGPGAVDSFEGPVYAWRPGWTAGRRLTGQAGVVCSGHASSDTVICFEGRNESVPNQLSFELHGGSLGPQAGGALPKLDSLIITTAADPAGIRKFQADISPDGRWVAWSARQTATGPETLKVQKVDDAATRVTVAQDVSRWTMTPDGKWLWLKAFNYDVNGRDSGTLQVAGFPAGDAPATLAAGVADYTVAGAKGVLLRSNLVAAAGDLVIMPDRDAPATTTTIANGVLGVLAQSPDGTRATYAKNFSQDQLVDLYVWSAGGGTPCTLIATTDAVTLTTFLSNGNLVVWALFDALNNAVVGESTNVTTCKTSPFALNVSAWAPIGQNNLALIDDATANGTQPALRVSRVEGGALPDQGTLVQTRVAPIFAPLAPNLPAIIYSITQGLVLFVDPAAAP